MQNEAATLFGIGMACSPRKPKSEALGNNGSKGLSTPSPKGEIIEPSAQALGKGNNQAQAPGRGDTKAANHAAPRNSRPTAPKVEETKTCSRLRMKLTIP
jgi:hypothetical protein